MPLERADFVGALWLTTPILLLLGSKIPRAHRWLLLVPFIALCLKVAGRFSFGQDVARNYTFGTVFYVALLNFNLLVLEDPYHDHVWTNGHPEENEKQSLYRSLSITEKLRWCFDNAYSTRGIGWNWGMRSTQLPSAPPPKTNKTSFIRSCARRILQQYLVHDIGARALLWLTHGGRETVCELSIISRSLAVASWGASSSAAMDIMYHVVCIVGVTTGLFWARPEDAHHLIGPWTQCYTLTNFWGRTWHQNFRRALQVPSRAIARDVAGAPQGSPLSRRIQWYVAFAISGLYHYAAAKMTLPSQSFAKTLTFFALMPNLLVLEDYAKSFAQRRFGCSGWHWRLFGFIWTFATLTITGAGFVDDLVTHGLVTARPILPFSLTAIVLNLAFGEIV